MSHTLIHTHTHRYRQMQQTDTDRQTDRQTDRHTHTHTHRQMDRQIDPGMTLSDHATTKLCNVLNASNRPYVHIDASKLRKEYDASTKAAWKHKTSEKCLHGRPVSGHLAGSQKSLESELAKTVKVRRETRDPHFGSPRKCQRLRKYVS